MKTFRQLLYSLWILTAVGALSFSHSVGAKVDPPNYNFSLDKFDLFFPGAKQETIKKSYPKEELVLINGSYKVYKYYIEHIRYKFAILVQYKEGVVVDFHARLPPYFLHDIFHQSLINRYGKQDVYKNDKEQSIYVWKNKKNLRHYYVGACTITCFPVYYAVRKIDANSSSDFKPILQLLKLNEDKTRQPQPSEAGT